MKKTAQALMGDRRTIAPYENKDHVPFPLDKPLARTLLQPFIDEGTLVTFTVRVPLAEVAKAADNTLNEYIEREWLSDCTMESPEFRAVGATYDEFDGQWCGLVHLQVTCALWAPNDG